MTNEHLFFALSELCCFENEGQNLISCIPKSLVFFLKKTIHSWLVWRNVEKFCVILWWLRSNAGQFLEWGMEKQKGLLRILTIPKSQRCLSLLWLRTTMHLWPESGHSNLTGMLPWCEQHREMQKFEFLITTEVELVFCILQGGPTKCKQMTGYFILESVFSGDFHIPGDFLGNWIFCSNEII